MEINERVREVGLVANWRLIAESRLRPAVVAGTSSDRLGTPAGQSYFVTVSKGLHDLLGLPAAPYTGVSWSTFEDRFLYPFGINWQFRPEWSAMLMNDGVHTHLSTSYTWRTYSLTVLAIDRRHFGLTLGVAF